MREMVKYKALPAYECFLRRKRDNLKEMVSKREPFTNHLDHQPSRTLKPFKHKNKEPLYTKCFTTYYILQGAMRTRKPVTLTPASPRTTTSSTWSSRPSSTRSGSGRPGLPSSNNSSTPRPAWSRPGRWGSGKRPCSRRDKSFFNLEGDEIDVFPLYFKTILYVRHSVFFLFLLNSQPVI